MSRNKRIAKNVDSTLFELEFEAVVSLRTTLMESIQRLQHNVIEFSVRYAQLVAKGKRLDKANNNKACEKRLIEQFGNDYENKGTRCRYMKIAAKANFLRQPEILANLPLDGRDTLYYLSRLDEPVIKELVEKKMISPDLTFSQTKLLVRDKLREQMTRIRAMRTPPPSVCFAVKVLFGSVEIAADTLHDLITQGKAISYNCRHKPDERVLSQLLSKRVARAVA